MTWRLPLATGLLIGLAWGMFYTVAAVGEDKPVIIGALLMAPLIVALAAYDFGRTSR